MYNVTGAVLAELSHHHGNVMNGVRALESEFTILL